MAGLVLHDAAEDDSGKLLKPTLESDTDPTGVFHFVKRTFDEVVHPAPSVQSAMTAVVSTSTRAAAGVSAAT